MRRIVHLYNGINSLADYLYRLHFVRGQDCFVRIITSSMDKEQAHLTAKEIKKLLPNSEILGSSSAVAVIYNARQIEDGTLIIIDTYKKLTLKKHIFSHASKTPQELAKEVHGVFADASLPSPPTVEILFSDNYKYTQHFTYATNDLTPFIRLVGGVSGGIAAVGDTGYVFTEDGILENSAIAFSAMGKEASNFAFASTSTEVLSDEYNITAVEDGLIKEIENTPALEWICGFLDLDREKMKSYLNYSEIVQNDYLAHFPLTFDKPVYNSRFTMSLPESGMLSYFYTPADVGPFKMGFINPIKALKEAHSACEAILNVPTEALFAYVCSHRRAYLQDTVQFELTPYDKYSPCGMFLAGEISNINGVNVFHNGTCVLSGVAEEANYIIPNIAALDNARLVASEDGFLKKAKEVGKGFIKSKNKSLFDKITGGTNDEDISSYIDSRTGIPNIHQFEHDNNDFGYSKICLMEVLTADALIASSGESTFFHAANEMSAKVCESAKLHGINDIKRYILNYRHYIFASPSEIDDDSFIESMRKVSEEFEYSTSPETGLSGVVRSVVAIDKGDDLLDNAMRALSINKDKQENFIIYRDMEEVKIQSSEEATIIALLNRAIKNNLIIPYYQGIYDNSLGKITKYEALMRIVDEDGTVYSPFMFMDIAKKYKYYKKISQMMIEQVFVDFENREEQVSVNISMFDIQSSTFRSWIVKRLDNFPRPENVTVEFVETEHYQSLDVLYEFVEKIRAIGCKIAIDDFGAGYSTFSTIVALRPDYIKIDGSIIGRVLGSKENLVILKTIKFLALQMKTQTIAEFVDNAQTQELIKKHDITYSQGFFFSKPMPFNMIDE